MERAIVSGVNFTVNAGEAIGVIGPSGGGKTSMGRVLVGVWPPARGSVRLDGAALDQWTSEDRGRYIGYVSQAIELFDGTVAENIARMDPNADSAAIVRAAQAAGAHEMILQMAAGYDTPIGESGASLSGGQRQRIALARALYGDPFLIVLDEPNSNLDNAGEVALLEAIGQPKARGAIVILIAHRPSVVSVCDKVLVLAAGARKAFGPRDEVLREVMAPPHGGGGAPNPLKVVGQSAPVPRTHR
jgi:ABC-type protease/lipase transport system fused ATPase/permease subunit